MLPPLPHLVDVVGTGGDGAHSFNISTCSMFVAAAAGAQIAKHGNRSVSSKTGSADVLEALGANIQLKPEAVAQSVQQCGIGFMFAPNHHPAMKNIGPVRRELGVRTIFNILGPLTNPANAPHILMGVFHPDLVGIQIRVLQRLGAQHALVVHGQDGLDEISLGATTLVAELKDGVVREYTLHPGLRLHHGQQPPAARGRARAIAPDAAWRAGRPERPGARHRAAQRRRHALRAANVADSLVEGIEKAEAVLDSGAARAKLDAFVSTTQALGA